MYACFHVKHVPSSYALLALASCFCLNIDRNLEKFGACYATATAASIHLNLSKFKMP